MNGNVHTTAVGLHYLTTCLYKPDVLAV